MSELTSNYSFPYTYNNLREAWASVMSEVLQAYTWDWWVSLSSKNPMPLEVLRNRFFWWLGVLRKSIGHHIEVVWVIERQRRGALHIHAVVYGVPKDNLLFWRAMVNLWEKYHSREGETFGDATIKVYSSERSGDLADYLAKERCKDLDVIEGSGSIFDKFGYSRGVKRFLNETVEINNFEEFKSAILGEPISACSSDPLRAK